MSETTWNQWNQRNGNVILNTAKEYYKNDKERLRENARDKYKKLFEEENIKRDNMEEIPIIICLKNKNKN